MQRISFLAVTALLLFGSTAFRAESGLTGPSAPLHSTVTKARFCGDTRPVVKPSATPWKCLNHGGVFHVRWSVWSDTTAKGQGIVEVDDCVPGCADGRLIHYRADLMLETPVDVHGQLLFSQMLVRFLEPVPFGPRVQTVRLYA